MKPINPEKISQKIRTIIHKYNTYLKYLVLGPSSISRADLKTLLQAGLIEPAHVRFTLRDAYLDAHLKGLRQMSRKAVREYTIKHLQNTAGQFIDKFVEKQASELSSILSSQILDHTRQLRDAAKEEIAEGVIRNKSSKEIARRLRDKTQDYSKDWDRVVTTELARAQNLGSFDAITENNKDRPQSEIYVYKSGPHDAKTCKACIEFWFLPDGVTPRVYKLSELVANGTNMGKKSGDWKPTVDNTHPNERHYLLELPLGYGFKGGALVYISKDHDEHKFQKSRS